MLKKGPEIGAQDPAGACHGKSEEEQGAVCFEDALSAMHLALREVVLRTCRDAEPASMDCADVQSDSDHESDQSSLSQSSCSDIDRDHDGEQGSDSSDDDEIGDDDEEARQGEDDGMTFTPGNSNPVL